MLSLFITSMAVFLLTFALYRRYTVYRRQLRLPPGPKGIPIFGNIYNMPKSFEWLAYDKWSRQYGMPMVFTSCSETDFFIDSDLIYLNFSGTPVVVVHSLQAATDLFEKRSALYSDRFAASHCYFIEYQSYSIQAICDYVDRTVSHILLDMYYC